MFANDVLLLIVCKCVYDIVSSYTICLTLYCVMCMYPQCNILCWKYNTQVMYTSSSVCEGGSPSNCFPIHPHCNRVPGGIRKHWESQILHKRDLPSLISSANFQFFLLLLISDFHINSLESSFPLPETNF